MGIRAYTWITEDGVTSEPVEIAPEPAKWIPTDEELSSIVNRAIESLKYKPKLYLLEKIPGAAGWMRYDMMVGILVRATSEDGARSLAADNSEDEGRRVWLDKNLTSCTQIEEMGPVAVLMKSMVNG